MRWYVLGRGSVGCLWASHLAKVGHPVTLLVRPGGADGATRGTLSVEEAWAGSDGRRWQQKVEIEEAGAAGNAPIERLLVATKSQDVATGVASLASRLSDRCSIVLLQNGMGAADDVMALEAMQERATPPLLFVGSTTQGSFVRGAYDIVHAGNGVTWLGVHQATMAAAKARGGEQAEAEVSAEFEAACTSLSATALGEIIRESPAAMEGRLWGKLAINCAANPLTALLRCRNGEVIATEHGRAVIRPLCEEVANVMSAAGLRTMRGDTEGDVGELAIDLEGFVIEALERNAANYSSMCQDIDGGRPTEIEYINGAVVRAAEQLGVEVPCNRMLLNQIRMREMLDEDGVPRG